MAPRASRFVAAALCASAGSLVFVQPSVGGPSVPEARALSADALRLDAAAGVEEAGSSAGFTSLCAGMALGLAVSLSSMGAVHAEDKPAAAAPPPPPVNLKVMPDHRTSTAAEMKAWQKAWGKAQFKDKTEMQLNQAYALPTTGAGRYKQFGIDSGSPIRQIPEADNGAYPMRPSQKKPAPDAALLARVKPFLNEGKYGNYYSPSSPYLYVPN
jgi:hypothetical protein